MIILLFYFKATNTEKHLKTRSAAHPAHLRSKPLHPLAHNARSNSLTKREGSNETCYKICANETGSGGKSCKSLTIVNSVQYLKKYNIIFHFHK